MSGEAQVNFATLPAVVPRFAPARCARSASPRGQRNPAVPDVPTMDELGLTDFEVGTWSVLIAPKGVPPEIVQKVNAAVNAALADPAVRERLVAEGSEMQAMTPAETAAFVEVRERALGEGREGRGDPASGVRIERRARRGQLRLEDRARFRSR